VTNGDVGLGEERERLMGRVVTAAMAKSTESLSKMTGANVSIESLKFGLVPISSAAQLAG